MSEPLRTFTCRLKKKELTSAGLFRKLSRDVGKEFSKEGGEPFDVKEVNCLMGRE